MPRGGNFSFTLLEPISSRPKATKSPRSRTTRTHRCSFDEGLSGELLGGQSGRYIVVVQQSVERRGGVVGYGRHDWLNESRYLGEANPLIEEGAHSDLVGSIEQAGYIATLSERFEGETQAGEVGCVWLLKVKRRADKRLTRYG